MPSEYYAQYAAALVEQQISREELTILQSNCSIKIREEYKFRVGLEID
jgi:hypothetical protein